MKGIVLGYDAGSRLTVLRGEDGRRYGFAPADWRDQRAPRKRDVVDFEIDGQRARDVFLIDSANGAPPPAAVAPAAALAAWPVTRVLVERPVMMASLMVLLASLTGAYAVGDLRISLFEAPELISRMAESLDSLVAVSGADPSPRLGAGVARVLLVLLLGLYLVPLLAGITLWKEFVGRPDLRLARMAGLAAMVLPILLPLLIILVVQAWVLPGLPDPATRLGRAGVTTPQQVFEVLRLYSTGTVLVVAAGALLWSAANGRTFLPNFMRRTAGEEDVVATAPAPGSAEVFAPVGSRAHPPRHAPVPERPARAEPRPAPPPAPRQAAANGPPAPGAEPAHRPPRPSPAAPPPQPPQPVPVERAETASSAVPAPPAPPRVVPTATEPGPAPAGTMPAQPPDPQGEPLDAMGLLAEDIRAALSREEPAPVQPAPVQPSGDRARPATDGQGQAQDRPYNSEADTGLPPRTGSVWPGSLAAGLAQADLVSGPREEADGAAPPAAPGPAEESGRAEPGPGGPRPDQNL